MTAIKAGVAERVEADRVSHWPHSAQRCKSHLDLDRIEEHAVRILARGIRTQRLVAFVGAGASMSYGRLTWRELMAALYARMERTDNKRWEELQRKLWPKGKSDFLEDNAHPLKSQILSDVWDDAASDLEIGGRAFPGAGVPSIPVKDERGSTLQQETIRLLKDFHGFVDWVIDSLIDTRESAPQAVPVSALLTSREAREKYGSGAGKPAPKEARGLLAVLNVIAQMPGWLDSNSTGSIEKIITALQVQSIQLDSPVRQLVLDWGIRRFITTNYDGEIERGLRALSYREMNGVANEVHRNQYETLNFSKKETGQALRFALEGPRRHASVLHLHGDVAAAESLIITESQYQQLYLDDHPLRDLVTNATLANFAANPMLFVGSDVNEDDVLRPMRQFMSGPGHRKDRMAVALFLATKDPAKRAVQKATLLLKYGVYAIHVGRVDKLGNFADDGTTKALDDPYSLENWLHRYYDAHSEFNKAVGLSNTVASISAASGHFFDAIECLGIPTQIEGCDVSEIKELGFSDDLKMVRTALLRLCKQGGSFEVKRTLLLCEVTASRIMSCFLCAKLIDLRRRALVQISRDTRLALIYQGWPVEQVGSNPMAVDSGMIRVRTRHAVSLNRADVPCRFAPVHESARLFDEGLDKLGAAIRNASEFRSHRGRRVIVACSARGFGKGGQSDRLIAHSLVGSGNNPVLRKFLDDLGGYAAEPGRLAILPDLVHVNLSFSNELGPIISLVTAVLHDIAPSPEDLPAVRDQMEMLERGLRQLCHVAHKHRLLIVLGNAGVLFNAQGHPKNGQIQRVLRMLQSPRFAAAPFDLLMYVGESQVPAALRLAPADDVEDALARAAGELPADQRLRRRLDRLNIQSRPPAETRVLVHALSNSRVSDIAAAYFPHLARALKWASPSIAERADELARNLYYATGGSRFAQTLILALLDSVDDVGSPEALARELLVRLSGSPTGSAVENVIEAVLDQWASLHLLQCRLRRLPMPEGSTTSPLQNAMRVLYEQPSGLNWQLAMELLWHSSAFSHPVEREVLLCCPRVHQALLDLRHAKPYLQQFADDILIETMLELLTHWCLIFRIEPRPLPLDPPQSGRATFPVGVGGERYRYAPHRHMQRHFLRLMGGRNVEATQWDQFTTSVYASMPDEAPRLRAEVHRTLTDVVQTLTRYPVAAASVPAAPEPWRNLASTKDMLLEADRIRAAYYLVRSTYSLAVVSHLAPEASDAVGQCGHMEHYRRLVRWITHAAQYWEEAYDVSRYAKGEIDGLRWARLAAAEKAVVPVAADPEKARRIPMGVFYAGELIWLYNECGVISLAQGKLHDAEQLLSLAEQAARNVEHDDSGSLHTRIRLHTALVQFERGRPHRARQILQPISERLNGHPVPPLLALSYLGLIEHIGGNYDLAGKHYTKALTGLRRYERSRAEAFVLMNLADLERGLRPTHVDDALIRVDEAISLAQQGGHEDLRVMATVARVRIHVEARQAHRPGLFEQLSFAEDYAARMDIPRLACDVHGLRARLLLLQGEYRLSAADATASLEIAAMYDLKLKKARGLLTLAEIYRHRGELAGARGLAQMGKEIAVSCDYYACVRGFKDLELSLGQPSRSDVRGRAG